MLKILVYVISYKGPSYAYNLLYMYVQCCALSHWKNHVCLNFSVHCFAAQVAISQSYTLYTEMIVNKPFHKSLEC